MRALVYADLQATDGHERCFTEPTKLLQMYRLEMFFDAIDAIYDAHHCDALWDLGDTTDDRTAVPVPVIDLMCDRLERYTGAWNMKLVGNHEQFLRDTKLHAGKMFRRFFNVTESCKNVPIGKVNILCASYHDDQNVVVEFLRRERSRQPASAIILGHFEVFGSQLPGGASAGGIPRKELEFVNFSLLGHIHKPQRLGENVYYVGSPFQQNWGESGEEKRVAIVDIEGNKASVFFVPLTGFPAYRQVGFEDFVKLANPDSEDRFKVVLRNIEETERFYAHPLASRSDEAVYDYEQVVESASPDSNDYIPRSKHDIMRRYLELNPPKDWNIPLDAESMLSMGEQISTGT